MSARPSIAYVLPDPGIPVGGTKGASVHVESLCSAMARAGASVTLYASKVTGPLRSAGAEGVRVVPVAWGPVASGAAGETGRMDAARRFFAEVGRRLDADRPDWVHERLALFAGGGGEMASSRGLARVVEVNAPVAAERARHFRLEHVAEAELAESAALAGARVLAVSGPLATWALRQGAAEAVVVGNGADTVALDPHRSEAEGRRLRAEGGLQDRVVVGFSGSLKPWHGVELLLEAAAAAGTILGHPLGLLVVGDGPLRPRLEEAASRLATSLEVRLTGAVPFAEMAGHLAAMDIAVAPYLPSDDFYFSPLKVAEAMAAGLPVVASDFPPVRDLLAGTGELVAPGDPEALRDALAGLAADPARRAEMGRRARRSAVERLDWATVAHRTMAFAGASIPVPATAGRSA